MYSWTCKHTFVRFRRALLRTSRILHGMNGFIVSNLAHPEYGKTKVDMSGSLAGDEQAHDKLYAGYPLCSSDFEDERRFEIHLARHLQELVFSVLPSDDADCDFEKSSVEAEDVPAQENSSDGDSGESAEDTDPQLDSKNWVISFQYIWKRSRYKVAPVTRTRGYKRDGGRNHQEFA